MIFIPTRFSIANESLNFCHANVLFFFFFSLFAMLCDASSTCSDSRTRIFYLGTNYLSCKLFANIWCMVWNTVWTFVDAVTSIVINVGQVWNKSRTQIETARSLVVSCASIWTTNYPLNYLNIYVQLYLIWFIQFVFDINSTFILLSEESTGLQETLFLYAYIFPLLSNFTTITAIPMSRNSVKEI